MTTTTGLWRWTIAAPDHAAGERRVAGELTDAVAGEPDASDGSSIVDGVAHGRLVFTALDGGALNGSYVTHRSQALLKSAGIERLRMHDVRHGFVSALFADGVPLEEISRLVGHSSTATTRAVYLHLIGDKGRLAAASAMDRHFAETGS